MKLSNLWNWLRPERMQTSGTADPEGWLLRAFGGSTAASGVRVNQDTALSDAPLYQVITMISQDLAMLDVEVRRDGDTEPDPTHAISRIWNDRGNEDMNPFEVREVILGNALLHGNGLGAIHWRNGRAIGVYPFRPGAIWMELTPNTPALEQVGLNNTWIYRYSIDNETNGILLPHEVFHIKNYSDNGRWGFSPMWVHRDLIGNGLALTLFAGMSFNNGAKPGGVLTKSVWNPSIPAKLGPEAVNNLRAEWNAIHQGLDNTNKIAILQDGMQFTPVGYSNVDADMMNATKFHREQIGSIYKVPPQKMGALEAATFNNVAEMNRAYVQQCLKPWAKRWEQESYRKLAPTRQYESLNIEVSIDFKPLLRPDHKTQIEYYTNGRQWGYLSANDVRRMEGLPEIGEQGEIYLTPSNMSDSETREPFSVSSQPEQSAPDTEPEPEEENREETTVALVSFARKQLHRKMSAEIRGLKNGLKRRKPFEEFVTEYYDRFKESLFEPLEAVVGVDGFVGPLEMDALVNEYVAESLNAVQQCTSSEELLMSVSDWPKRVETFVQKIQV